MIVSESTGKYGKDAYYFPHDSNAKDDPKVVQLIEQMGLEGYGIFWVLIEILREQPEYKYPLAAVPGIARRYCTTSEKVKTVIGGYGLFEIDVDMFFSPAFSRRMMIIDEHRKKLSNAGKRGNEVKYGKLSPPDRQATATRSQEKERKEKEIKGYNTAKEAFDDIKQDDLYIEELRKIVLMWGIKSDIDNVLFRGINKFLAIEFEPGKEVKDTRYHLKRWLNRNIKSI